MEPQVDDGAAIEASTALSAYVADRCAAVRVEVRWLGVDPAHLASGGRAAWDGDPCRPNPTLSLTWAVGADVDHLTVRPDLAVWVPAAVAAHPVAAGDAVDVAVGEARLGGVGALAPDTAGPWVASRALAAGEPLTRVNVRRPADAASGAPVSVRVVVGDLAVAADGRLLAEATVGDEVRAYVFATRAVVSGRLVAPDRVDVAP